MGAVSVIANGNILFPVLALNCTNQRT
jgi:hypothetical protein